MHNRYILLSIALFTSLLIGCSKSPTALLIPKHGESSDLIALDKLFERLEYIPLESKSSIGQISQLGVSLHHIVVLDKITNRVLLFDREGKEEFVLTFGLSEFIAESFHIDQGESQLILFSASKDKMLYFDLNQGHLLKEAESGLYASDFVKLSPTNYVFFNSWGFATQEDPQKPKLIFTDSLFNPYLHELYEPQYSAEIGIGGSPLLCLSDGSYGLRLLYDDNIYRITPKGVKKSAVLLFENDRAKEGLYQLLADEYSTQQEVQDYIYSNDICYIQNYLESKKHSYLSYQHGNCKHYAYFNRGGKLLADGFFDHRESLHGILINNLDGFQLPELNQSNGTLLYTSLGVSDFIASIEQIKPPFGESKRRLHKLSQSLNETDNPIVIIAYPIGAKER